MRFCTIKSTLVWLAALGYLMVALGGAMLVLCDNGQDHYHLELAHAGQTCATDGSLAPDAADCQDTSLDQIAPSDPAPVSGVSQLPAMPAPAILMELAWATDDPGLPMPVRDGAHIAPPATHRHLEAITSTLLLI